MISIVIPTYNSSRFMPDLMDSVFKQVDDDMEVIIVDDCSTDDTLEIAKRYPTRIIQMEQNGGPAKSRNRAVNEAKGDIIFFLDSDVEVLDGTVQEVKDYFEKNPAAKCVIGICSTEPLNKGFVPTYMAMFEYIHLIGQEYDKVSVFAPRCGAIKKELFLSAGGYDENYRGADVEDFELARRINKTDDIILNPKMIVKHQFADFRQVIKNYFKRTVMWVKLFMKEKKLDNAGPTAPSNGIAAICAFLSFLTLIFMPAVSFAKPLFWTLIAIYLVSNFKWWNFMLREAGFGFAVRALFLNYFLGIEIIASAIYALVSYSFSKNESLGGL
jgi:glycosyltransferase involved in cell wall biosynthesis